MDVGGILGRANSMAEEQRDNGGTDLTYITSFLVRVLSGQNDETGQNGDAVNDEGSRHDESGKRASRKSSSGRNSSGRRSGRLIVSRNSNGSHKRLSSDRRGSKSRDKRQSSKTEKRNSKDRTSLSNKLAKRFSQESQSKNSEHEQVVMSLKAHEDEELSEEEEKRESLTSGGSISTSSRVSKPPSEVSKTHQKNIDEEEEEEEEEEEQQGNVEDDEEYDLARIARRLPRCIPDMTEDDWAFPIDQVTANKVIASPGQFSVIEKAMWNGEPVCIKQVNVHDEAYAVTEITLLRFLDHPNVLPLIGATRKSVNGTDSIIAVTEFMAGGSLDDAMKADFAAKTKKKALFPWKLRLRIALEAARAIQYIHSQGVIHRDIKRDNLLLTSRGDDLECKLADFGMARGVFGKHELQDADEIASAQFFALEEEKPDRKKKRALETRPSHRRAQTICGTDETMAPEMQLCTEEHGYTTAVDVFSFGCILVELCCSRALGGMSNFLERTPQNHFAFDIDQVRACAVPGCPTSFLECAVNCIAYEPEDRPLPQDIVEWLEELVAEFQETNGRVELVTATTYAPQLENSGKQAVRKANGCCVIS